MLAKETQPPMELELNELQVILYQCGLKTGQFQILVRVVPETTYIPKPTYDIVHAGYGRSDAEHDFEAECLELSAKHILERQPHFKLAALENNPAMINYRRYAMHISVHTKNQQLLGTMIVILTSFDGKNRDQVLRNLRKCSADLWLLWQQTPVEKRISYVEYPTESLVA